VTDVRTVPLLPDLPIAPDANASAPSASSGFARVLDDVSASLDRAQSAEDSFAAHAGSLQDAVYERARADVTVSVAAAAASRIVQSAQTLLNMQV
jgi:flagellar hook-basal body complex protein FliE